MPKQAFVADAQQAMSFLLQQATYIESEVDKIEYPEVQYAALIPVDFSAPEWTKTVTFFSQDMTDKADWFSGKARDVPKAEVERTKFESAVHMAAIGYGYDIEEISQAIDLGVPLTTDKAEAARFAYECFVDDVALYGDTAKSLNGLINYPGVTTTTAAADGTGSSTLWTAKTPDQIARDINAPITQAYVDTKQLKYLNTVLISVERYNYIASTRFDPNGNWTILDWIAKNNIYTALTKQPLEIRAVRGLETAGAGGTQRMIVYRRDPKVLKMHIPMRHRFLESMRTGPLLYEVPGIFRLGGVDIRRPLEVRYVDAI